jgi:hypothetical protein
MSKENAAWTEYCRSLSPAIAGTCARTAVSAGPTALVKALGMALEDWKFRHAFARGGWYRLGGIVDGGGERISDNLEAWLEQELAARDGDIDRLVDDYADEELYATRLVDQTHYLTANVGEAHEDFLLLEIEDLQEMRAHRLFAGDPDSLEELSDPRSGNAKLLPFGLPFYALRRLQHIGALLQRMLVQKPEPAPIHRMLEEWGKSSAGQTSAFSNQWVIATREHLDRHQQAIVRAQPIATLAGDPPEFAAAPETKGLQLQEALNRFDRACGYPMAWFFHMLTSKAVPHWVAQSVVEDALAGFAYLPQRDVDVVRGWLHRPYSV